MPDLYGPAQIDLEREARLRAARESFMPLPDFLNGWSFKSGMRGAEGRATLSPLTDREKNFGMDTLYNLENPAPSQDAVIEGYETPPMDRPDIAAITGAKGGAKQSAVKSIVNAAPGMAAEAQSNSALDNLMSQLAAHRQAKTDEDRSQMWMNFFSKMAGSKDPSLGGTIAEGATTLAPTMQAQRAANEARYDKSLEDQIKIAQYKQDYGLKERATSADELRAKAAMAEAGASSAYRAKMLDMMGSGAVNSKNYPQLLNALTKMKEQEMMTGVKNPKAFALEAQLNQFTSGGKLTDPTMTGDPLGLRGPK